MGVGGSKGKKEPKAPRARTAYIFFSMERRVDIKEKNPEMGVCDIAKKVAELWNAMSDEEK